MTSMTPGPALAAVPDRQPLLQATGVSKRYGNTVALAGSDISVVAGEILGLVGHNGAGKSTLMRLLAGREAADTGRITWHGGGSWNQKTAESAGVRMVYQELALCPTSQSPRISRSRAPPPRAGDGAGAPNVSSSKPSTGYSPVTASTS